MVASTRLVSRNGADAASAAQPQRLQPRHVAKPWGVESLPEPFAGSADERIGEIWFDHPKFEDLPLLAKFIFTSQRLSVQVHPGDADARSAGFSRGKTECWYILEAQAGAQIALGLKGSFDKEDVRAAALDGSIGDLLDWRPVQTGDFIFVPAGTIHAIGAGLTLLELQQNADVTYRLHDYGRARRLHLDEGLAVANCAPAAVEIRHTAREPEDMPLLSTPLFSVVRATGADGNARMLERRRRWVLPLEGVVTSAGEEAEPGSCLLLPEGAPLHFLPGAHAIIAAEGPLQPHS